MAKRQYKPATFDPTAEDFEGILLHGDEERPIVVCFREDFGPEGLDIRQCYWPEGTTLPAYGKGIRIPYDSISSVLSAILALYDVDVTDVEEILTIAELTAEETGTERVLDTVSKLRWLLANG